MSNRPRRRHAESILAFLAVFFTGCVVGVAVQAFVESSPAATPKPVLIQKSSAVALPTPAPVAAAAPATDTASASETPSEPLTKKLVRTVSVPPAKMTFERTFDATVR